MADSYQLFVSDIDGHDRERISIGPIAVADAHRMDDEELDLNDESKIRMMGNLSFSPDGTKLLLVASISPPDQAQVIVLDRDGQNARTASDQPGYVLDRPVWSPDMTKIAYTQSDFGGSFPRVVVTDLETDAVTNVGLDTACYPLQWDSSSTGLYCSTYDSDADTSNLYHFDIATRAISTIDPAVSGKIDSISSDGDTVLLIRRTAESTNALIRTVLSAGEESTILEGSGFVGGYFLHSPTDLVVRHTPAEGGQASFQYAHVTADGVELTTVKGPGIQFFDFFPG